MLAPLLNDTNVNKQKLPNFVVNLPKMATFTRVFCT